MGAAESRSLASTSTDKSIRGKAGFHVLRVADGSPAAQANIEPYFDYIVGLLGQAINASTHDVHGGGNVEEMLARVVEDYEDRKLTLQIWSSKRAELRDVTVIPSRDWSVPDEGPSSSVSSSQPSLLGLSLRLCNPDGALEKVWHVLEILENSPAESAGLVPFGDYILGYASGLLQKESDFYELVAQHEDKPLRLFVYNADYDVTREVVIVPNRAWGTAGEDPGLLGCGVGYGVLHRIPKPGTRPPSSIGKDHDTTPTQRQITPPTPSGLKQRTSTSSGYDMGPLQAQMTSPRPQVSTLPPKRTATIVPSTPPRGPASALYSPHAGSSVVRATSPNSRSANAQVQAALGYGPKDRLSGYTNFPPPRSPSAQGGARSSTAEVIAEEEEDLN